jgi:hypothetical protein
LDSILGGQSSQQEDNQLFPETFHQQPILPARERTEVEEDERPNNNVAANNGTPAVDHSNDQTDYFETPVVADREQTAPV